MCEFCRKTRSQHPSNNINATLRKLLPIVMKLWFYNYLNFALWETLSMSNLLKLYERGGNVCINSLHGRLFMNKGDNLMTIKWRLGMLLVTVSHHVCFGFLNENLTLIHAHKNSHMFRYESVFWIYYRSIGCPKHWWKFSMELVHCCWYMRLPRNEHLVSMQEFCLMLRSWCKWWFWTFEGSRSPRWSWFFK